MLSSRSQRGREEGWVVGRESEGLSQQERGGPSGSGELCPPEAACLSFQGAAEMRRRRRCTRRTSRGCAPGCGATAWSTAAAWAAARSATRCPSKVRPRSPPELRAPASPLRGPRPVHPAAHGASGRALPQANAKALGQKVGPCARAPAFSRLASASPSVTWGERAHRLGGLL